MRILSTICLFHRLPRTSHGDDLSPVAIQHSQKEDRRNKEASTVVTTPQYRCPTFRATQNFALYTSNFTEATLTAWLGEAQCLLSITRVLFLNTVLRLRGDGKGVYVVPWEDASGGNLNHFVGMGITPGTISKQVCSKHKGAFRGTWVITQLIP